VDEATSREILKTALRNLALATLLSGLSTASAKAQWFPPNDNPGTFPSYPGTGSFCGPIGCRSPGVGFCGGYGMGNGGGYDGFGGFQGGRS